MRKIKNLCKLLKDASLFVVLSVCSSFLFVFFLFTKELFEYSPSRVELENTQKPSNQVNRESEVNNRGKK